MNANTLTLLAVLAGSTALAQGYEYDYEYHQANAPMPAVIQNGQPCHTPPPAVRPGGRWELRTTQQWVPGATTQVYVAGACYGYGFRRVCQPGQYVTQQLPGHYENRQDWVFVAFDANPGYGYGYRRDRDDRFDRRHDMGHGRHGRRF